MAIQQYYERFLEDYINALYERSNMGMKSYRQGLYTKEEYHELLKPVVDLIKVNKDASLDEYREVLYRMSGIEESVKDLIFNHQLAPGMVLNYSTDKFEQTLVIGDRTEYVLDDNGLYIPKRLPMEKSSIFDLASTTKLFTSLCILDLCKKGMINLDDDITKYADQFHNLKGKAVTILDLLAFQRHLKSKRLEGASSKEEAEEFLFDIELDEDNNPNKPYTDMGYMILKYVIEKASGMSYYDYLKENILSQLGMDETYATVPNNKLDRIASTNLGVNYYNDGNFTVDKGILGDVHDPKARIMGNANNNLSGHAGIFSTIDDMDRLARGIIDGKILNKEFLDEMAVNKTGRLLENGKYTQHLGMGVYSKNPILNNSEVHPALSGGSFAAAGYTGTQTTVDRTNGISTNLLANRTHNRAVRIDDMQEKKIITNGATGVKTIVLPDGREIVDARRFAFDRDPLAVRKLALLAIQNKFLEDILQVPMKEHRERCVKMLER